MVYNQVGRCTKGKKERKLQWNLQSNASWTRAKKCTNHTLKNGMKDFCKVVFKLSQYKNSTHVQQEVCFIQPLSYKQPCSKHINSDNQHYFSSKCYQPLKTT